jgi:hypothetical protein
MELVGRHWLEIVKTYQPMVDTSAVSVYSPWIVSDKDPNSAQAQHHLPDQRPHSIVVSEVFGHIAVGAAHEGQSAEGKDTAFDRDALVVGDNLAAAATEPGQEAAVLVLDDTHSPYLRHLSCLGVVKYILLAV